MVGTAEPLSAERESSIQKLIALAENDFAGFVEFSLTQFFNQLEFDEASKAGKNMVDVWAQPLPGIEKYEVPFSLREDKKKKLTLKDFHPDMIAFANQLLDKYRTSLDTRVDDGRHPLEPARRLAFESMLAESNPENDPEFIPPEVADLQCNIFGHICPVVFVGEALTETSEERRRGRYISFTVKMRVVRRDNHTCQVCSKHLRDDEVEFDHIIPVAKGGSSEEHNIRLTCFDCNREKSDNIEVCAVQH